MCLVSIKLLIVPLFLTYTITNCSLYFFAHNLFLSNNTYSLDLHSVDLQTTIILFTRNASSHKLTELLLLVACFALPFYMHEWNDRAFAYSRIIL